jgi:hypothetical protein
MGGLLQSGSDLDKSLWLRTGPRQTAHNVTSGNRPRFGACWHRRRLSLPRHIARDRNNRLG